MASSDLSSLLIITPQITMDGRQDTDATVVLQRQHNRRDRWDNFATLATADGSSKKTSDTVCTECNRS